MTKKHFEQMAAAFNDERKKSERNIKCAQMDTEVFFYRGMRRGLIKMAAQFCIVAEQTNKNFDPLRFMKACGF